MSISPRCDLPRHYSDLNAQFLSKIIKLRIVEETLRVNPNVEEGNGYLSLMVRISCRTENISDDGMKESKTLDYIAKLVPEDGFAKEIVLKQKLDQLEIDFYRKILPELMQEFSSLGEYTCPFIFGDYTQNSIENYSSILILDDLKPKNYYILDVTAKTPFVIEKGLDFLAKLHFSGFLVQAKKNLPLIKLYDFLEIGHSTDFTDDEIVNTLFTSGMELLILFLQSHDPGNRLIESTDFILKNGAKIFRKIVEKGDSVSPTLLHGDLWPNNILYNKDKNSFIAIDWQTVGYGDVCFDLSVFLLTCLDLENLGVNQVREYTKRYFQLFTALHKTENFLCRNESEFVEFFETFGAAFSFIWATLSFQSLQETYATEWLVKHLKYYDTVNLGQFFVSLI